MMKKNNRNMGMAIIAITMLMGMAFLGLVVPGEVEGDTIIDNHLVTMVSVDPMWIYSTSTVDVDVTYALAPVDNTLELSNLTITVVESGSVISPIALYRWNLTADGGAPVSPYVWSFNGTQNEGDWVVNVTADFFNGTSGDNHIGSRNVHFQIVDGEAFIGEISVEPKIVDNSGNDEVNVTLMFFRTFEELDTDAIEAQFFHVDTMSWVSDEILNIPEPGVENITDGDHNTTAWSVMNIPEDLPVGEYKLYFNAVDLWGYEEEFNETLFNVIWKELPPTMNNGTVYMHEDDFAVIDLDDHFMDVNGQDMMYYINNSNVENLTIEFVDENTINITAPVDWNGDQAFDINVTDGVDMAGHNLTFTMTVMVEATPDNLTSAVDMTIEVNENDDETSFNALDLFYDPDGPVENLTVSLGWEWALNETNVSFMKPLWSWADMNFSVVVNETDNTDAKVASIADLEEGTFEFPVAAWINGTWMLNATAMIEIVPVNDVPAPTQTEFNLFKNEAQTFNLSALFVDADSTDLNFTINATMAENVGVVYNWETFDLTLTPALNWTGTTQFNVTATDGVDEMEYTMTIEVILRSYTVSGAVSFAIEGAAVNLSNVTMMIGDNEVEFDDNGNYTIVLLEGDYAVTITVLPATLFYDAAVERSGYMMPEIGPINLTADETYNVAFTYEVYVSPVEEATWADLDFDNAVFSDDDDLTVIVPVKEDSVNKTGFDALVVKLMIVESDDEELNFTMEWDATEKQFTIVLTGDDIDNLGDGKKEYYFTNEDGTVNSTVEKYEFKSKDDNAGPMTIIILVALIVLVLVALIFIMKKPSDEDFDEDEDEEEEDEGRSCPGCGEVVTDDEAEECPFCGEDLEEE